MSYDILYKKYNVELSNGYILPLVCIGSNNCYTVQWNGRERRERSWTINNFYDDGEKRLIYPKNQLENDDLAVKHRLIEFVRERIDNKEKTDSELEKESSLYWLYFRTTKQSTVKELTSALNRTKRTVNFSDFIRQNSFFEISFYVWEEHEQKTLYKKRIYEESDLLEAEAKYKELGNVCRYISGISENLTFKKLSGDFVISSARGSLFEKKRNHHTYWVSAQCIESLRYAPKRFDTAKQAQKYIDEKLYFLNDMALVVKHIDDLTA